MPTESMTRNVAAAGEFTTYACVGRDEVLHTRDRPGRDSIDFRLRRRHFPLKGNGGMEAAVRLFAFFVE